MKKYLMITGSYPPDICGVGDYTARFIDAADEKEWKLYYSSNWRLVSLKKKIREINSFECENIFMQYPTQGYGWSLLPQMLCLYYSLFTNKTFIVVLHELSQRSFKAKIASVLLLLANRVIFTNDFEKKYAIHYLPFFKHKYFTIRILPNIAPANFDNTHSWVERQYDVVYFGHLRPLKGLEDFFDAINTIQKRGIKTLKVAIIGQVLPEYQTYVSDLKSKYSSLQLDYYLSVSVEKVSALLNKAKIAFLPFPDGVSERRGSFLAAIYNGALVLTYRGPFVTESLNKICYFTTPHKAYSDIVSLLDTITDSTYKEKRNAIKDYIHNDLPNSWAEIVNLYKYVCKTI